MTADVDALFGGAPSVGDLDQAFLFLTVSPSGAVDTCLLSRMELRPASYGLAVVVASRRARANLADGAAAFALGIRDHRRDGLGIELTPMRFQMAERLHVEERWDRTDRLLDLL